MFRASEVGVSGSPDSFVLDLFDGRVFPERPLGVDTTAHLGLWRRICQHFMYGKWPLACVYSTNASCVMSSSLLPLFHPEYKRWYTV
ncbi:hypothetical protein HanIR_Chr01g0027981 [Helianthus annuus]|nr:hypothetical protein HanIR_Chr01g0027981 [Helianthus annuus]